MRGGGIGVGACNGQRGWVCPRAGSLAQSRRPMGGAAPPPTPRSDCRREACAIQACLKRRSFDATRCGDAIATLRACCGRLPPGTDNVHCPLDNAAGWGAGRGEAAPSALPG